MNFSKSIYTLSFTLFFFSAAINAQVKTDKKKTETKEQGTVTTDKDGKTSEKVPGVMTDEIVVERPYKPVLADAAKIRRSPDLNSSRILKSNQNYRITNRKLNQNSDIKQLQAQPLPGRDSAYLYNNYAKAGFGNYNTGLAELYLNTGADQAMQAGAYFKHLNQEGKLLKQQFSRQEFGVFGKSILDDFTLSGDLGYNRYGTYFYGADEAGNALSANPEKQNFNMVSLSGELTKNYQQDQTSDYGLKADAYLFSDKFNARENSFALSGFVNKEWKEFNIGLNASADFAKTKDSLSFSNNILKVNPYIKLQGATYRLTLGVNLVQQFGANSKFNFFPSVSVEVPIVPEYATLFGGFIGDVNRASLRNFANENPYLNNNLEMRNAIEKTHFYGGIKGNGGAGLGYKAMVYYKKVDDMALFLNDSLRRERFNVVYDDVKITGIEGEINVKISETFTLGGKVNINNYSMKNQEKAWFMPQVKLSANARAYITDALTMDAEIVMSDQTYGIDYLSSTPSLVRVKGYADLSVGAEYKIKRFGIFAHANNILNTKYQRYLYYPKVGVNIIGGLNYSF